MQITPALPLSALLMTAVLAGCGAPTPAEPQVLTQTVTRVVTEVVTVREPTPDSPPPVQKSACEQAFDDLHRRPPAATTAGLAPAGLPVQGVHAAPVRPC